jgi:hypothetical protein
MGIIDQIGQFSIDLKFGKMWHLKNSRPIALDMLNSQIKIVN